MRRSTDSSVRAAWPPRSSATSTAVTTSRSSSSAASTGSRSPGSPSRPAAARSRVSRSAASVSPCGSVLPGLRPRAVQQQQPDGGALVGGEEVAHEDEVAGRLRHLGALVEHRAHVHRAAGEGAGGRGGLDHRRLVGVVGEHQVGAADQDVDAGPEHRHRHGSALHVPRRAAPSPRAGPGRLVVGGGAPHRHVPRRLPTVVGPVPELGEGGQRLLLGQAAPVQVVGGAEEHGAVALVGPVQADQGIGDLDDLHDVRPRPRGGVGSGDAQIGHVAVEEELLGDRHVVDPAVPRLGGGGQHVVDVGDVARGDGPDLDRPGQARQHVGPDERGGVAQVRHVVRRDAARVDARRTGQRERGPVEHQVGRAGTGRMQRVAGRGLCHGPIMPDLTAALSDPRPSRAPPWSSMTDP